MGCSHSNKSVGVTDMRRDQHSSPQQFKDDELSAIGIAVSPQTQTSGVDTPPLPSATLPNSSPAKPQSVHVLSPKGVDKGLLVHRNSVDLATAPRIQRVSPTRPGILGRIPFLSR